MSNEKKSSPLENLWHGALVLLGIAVAVSIAVELLLHIWWILALVAAAVSGVWLVIRRLDDRDRW